MKSLNFFLLVFAFSIPIWIITAYAPDIAQYIPIKLPLSSVTTFCPMLAAIILVKREGRKGGVKALMAKSFDFKKIKDKRWYIVIIFFMPLIALLTFWFMKFEGIFLNEPNTPIITVLIYFFIFFIGAIGEEIGWSGYVIEPLQEKLGALNASIIIGLVWASWHIVPFSQAHRSSEWMFWQFMSTIFFRIIMVWIFNNTGKSVFAMVLFHTMINVSFFSFPNYGTHYSPFGATIFLFLTVVLVVMMWDTKTLTRFYFLKNSNQIQESKI